MVSRSAHYMFVLISIIPCTVLPGGAYMCPAPVFGVHRVSVSDRSSAGSASSATAPSVDATLTFAIHFFALVTSMCSSRRDMHSPLAAQCVCARHTVSFIWSSHYSCIIQLIRANSFCAAFYLPLPCSLLAPAHCKRIVNVNQMRRATFCRVYPPRRRRFECTRLKQ